MNAIMNEKGRQTKLLAAIAIIAMVVCAIAVVMPSGQVDAADESTSANEARIGDVSYSTFVAAVNAAVDGDTIEILANVTVKDCVDLGKTITIELNNHTIHTTSETSGMLIDVDQESDVTINGPGTLSNTCDVANGVLTVRAGSSLEVNNVTVDGKGYGIYVEGYLTDRYSGGVLVKPASHPELRDETITDDSKFATYLYLNDSTINTITMPAIGTNGMYGYEYIEVNDSNLNTTEYTAMYIPSNAKVIVNNTTIKASSGIDQRTGYLEINNSSITYTGEGKDKETGDGPTDFGVGISVIDAKGYSTADAVTVVNNVTFTGNEDGTGDIVMGVSRNNSEPTDVDGILESTSKANRNGFLSIDGMEFSTKTGDEIGVSYTDDGSVTVGQASKATITENYTLGSGKTFTVNNGGTVEVAPNTTVNMTGGKVIATGSWNLTVGAGADANLPKVTDSAGATDISPTITAVGDAAITINGIKPTYTAKETAENITDQSGLQDAINLGYPSIELEDVEINSDLVIDYAVTITGTMTITDGVTVTFTNGGHYDGYVTANGTTVDLDLTGSFTLGYGSVVIKDLNGTNPVITNDGEGDRVTVASGDVIEITGALNSKLTISAAAGTVILKDLNITSSGSIYFEDVTASTTVSADGTVSVYGQIMSADGNAVKITVGSKDTFRAYGGSVIQDKVTVEAATGVTDAIINIDGAMYTLTINDDINSSNIYGQTQTVVIGSTLDIVSGTTIIIQGQFVVNEGVTLTIQNGATLIINGTTSVMDVNGNIIIEDGGQLIVENSKAVDIAGSVQIYGDMNVKGGAVTVQEDGNITVAVEGELIVAAGTTVKGGATVDVLGQFDIDDITNAGTINLTGAVKTGDADSKITLKNGGTVNVNSYTVGKGVTKMALIVTDGQNTVTFTADEAETGFSGAVVTTASVKDAENKKIFTMSVSGSIGAVDGRTATTGTDPSEITQTVTIGGSKVAVSGDLTVGEDVAVANSGKLAVSGTITATAGAFTNSGTLDVTGTVTIGGATTKLDGTVNAAYYSLAVTGTTNPTTVYTTFENAVQSGATRVYVGIGDATVVVTESVTVPGTVTMVTVDATLQVGATDNRDITVTIADGARTTGKIVVYATLTFDNNRNDNASVTSDVVINAEPARTYTNLYTALASGAETVTLAGPVVLTSSITVPEGTTLVVPAGTGVQFNSGVTMTVNGTVQTAMDFTTGTYKDTAGAEKQVIFTDKTASTTDGTAKIVVNGKFMSSVTGRADADMFAKYKISGAYYDISDSTGAFTVIAPVAAAAAEAAADIVDGSIVVYGEVSMGDVAFNGTADKLTIDIRGKSTGNVTLSYATLDIDAQFTGSVSTAVGSIDLVNVIGIKVQDAYVKKGGSDVEYMYLTGTPAPVDPKVDASITVASGNVTVIELTITTVAATDDVPAHNAVALEVASGATMTVNGKLTAYDITVNGTLVAIDNGKVVADFAYVFGTLTVAEADTEAKVDAGSAEIGTLYVGLDKKYDNMTAAVINGTVTVTDHMVVSSEATVSEDMIEDFAESTVFSVEGSVWFTAYGDSASSDIEIEDVAVENADFLGWSEEQDGDLIYVDPNASTKVAQSSFGIGDYETLYAVIDYEIYSVYITADAGIGTVAVDGKVLVKTGNVFEIHGLKAGTHTIDYILNSGFEGTPTISVNGEAITGNTFTLSGTNADDLVVQISIYGTQPAAPSQGGSTASGGDDSLGLTDYLLIILVILIVIMAIIVAMRLMRS